MIKIALTEAEFNVLDETPLVSFVCMNHDPNRFQDIITNNRNIRYYRHQTKYGHIDDLKYDSRD